MLGRKIEESKHQEQFPKTPETTSRKISYLKSVKDLKIEESKHQEQLNIFPQEYPDGSIFVLNKLNQISQHSRTGSRKNMESQNTKKQNDQAGLSQEQRR